MSEQEPEVQVEEQPEVEDDYNSPENVAARREASGIVLVAHDFIADDTRQGSEVNPQLLVGREGEEPELRADVNPDHSNIQVDQHEGDPA